MSGLLQRAWQGLTVQPDFILVDARRIPNCQTPQRGIIRGDALSLEVGDVDLVYLDPPYVPRADDNCYVKRYHFLEGLASYWTAPGTEIVRSSRVRKIPKRFTPFSYRHTATDAFDTLFRRHANSALLLSYASNGFPDVKTLVAMMRRYKPHVEVVERPHRYHFGTHARATRNIVAEYLIIGT